MVFSKREETRAKGQNLSAVFALLGEGLGLPCALIPATAPLALVPLPDQQLVCLLLQGTSLHGPGGGAAPRAAVPSLEQDF